MSTITTRAGKGSELSYTEGDNNLKIQATAKTADYTLLIGDNRDVVEFNGTSLTATLPVAATIVAAANTTDYEVTIKNNHSTSLTVARSSTDTIDGATSYTLGQYESATFKVNQAQSGYNVLHGHDFGEGLLKIGGTAVTATAAELNYCDVTAAGTAQASKAVVLDASKNITSLGDIGFSGKISNQHVGLNAAPVGWTSGYTLDFWSGGLYGTSIDAFLANNLYHDGAWKYKGNGYGSMIRLESDGSTTYQTAPNNVSGAGAAATLTERLTLDVSGNLSNDGTITAGGKITSSDAISGFVTGVTEYVENDVGASSTAFDIATNIGAAFESVGPTSSGATNIWTALDSVPTGAKWVEIKIMGTPGPNATSSGVTVNARKTGSSTAAADSNVVFYSYVSASTGGNVTAAGFSTVKIPVDSSKRFDLYFSETGAVSTCSMYLVGFGV